MLANDDPTGGIEKAVLIDDCTLAYVDLLTAGPYAARLDILTHQDGHSWPHCPSQDFPVPCMAYGVEWYMADEVVGQIPYQGPCECFHGISSDKLFFSSML